MLLRVGARCTCAASELSAWKSCRVRTGLFRGDETLKYEKSGHVGSGLYRRLHDTTGSKNWSALPSRHGRDTLTRTACSETRLSFIETELCQGSAPCVRKIIACTGMLKNTDGGRVGGQPEVVCGTGLGTRFARHHFRDRQMQL